MTKWCRFPPAGVEPVPVFATSSSVMKSSLGSLSIVSFPNEVPGTEPTTS
jgi:hypothetical protein